MRLHIVAPLALLLACPSDTPSEGETDGSSSSGGSTDDPSMTSSATLTSTTMTSMSATGMTTEDTMTASTTDTTTTTTTDTDATTTDPDTSGETTDPTTTDATDPSTESGSSGGTTTGGDAAYGPCDFENDPAGECPKGEQCSILPEGNHWCAIPCDMDASDCPDVGSGDAAVECSGFYMTCALNCTDGQDCPDGMVCEEIPLANISRCGWPGA